jgi:hypothetical protein
MAYGSTFSHVTTEGVSLRCAIMRLTTIANVDKQILFPSRVEAARAHVDAMMEDLEETLVNY